MLQGFLKYARASELIKFVQICKPEIGFVWVSGVGPLVFSSGKLGTSSAKRLVHLAAFEDHLPGSNEWAVAGEKAYVIHSSFGLLAFVVCDHMAFVE